MATTTITKTETLVGKRIRRKEDPRLITGTATYVDDIKLPGMHHACILRSPHAAARIKSIDAKAALALPGVVAVFTGADIAGVGPVPCGASLPGLRIPPHSILATDRVYFVGHPVAVAVATDRYIAADAIDAIEVEYEPTQAVADPEKALAPGAPAVHPEWPDNTAFTFHQEGGEPEKAFAEAEVVVKQRITSGKGFRRSGGGGQAAHHQPALDSHRHRNPWRGGRASRRRKEPDPLYLHADSASGAHARCPNARPLRKPPARDHARSRRRLRQQAQRVCRRSADGLRRPAHRQARQVDRIAARELPVHHSWPRPRGLLRDRRQARRHRAGPASQTDPGPGRVPSTAHARHPHALGPDDARPLQVPQHLGGYRRRLHQLRAHRRVPRRGPSRSHARHRAHDGPARRGIEDGPVGAAPDQLHRQRRVPLRHRYRTEL